MLAGSPSPGSNDLRSFEPPSPRKRGEGKPPYSFRATLVSRLMLSSMMRPRCRSRMPSLRHACSCRLTLSRAARVEIEATAVVPR